MMIVSSVRARNLQRMMAGVRVEKKVILHELFVGLVC